MPEFQLTTYLAVGVVLMCASALQGAVGFAAGLFGIPLLMLVAGLELPAAVMTMLLASFLQNIGGMFHLREEIHLRRSLLPILIRLSTIPIGIAMLHFATSLPESYVKAVIGVVILALLVIQWRFAPDQPTELHAIWTPVAFGSSGFLVGFCGMGGPPMVLWVMAQPWNAERSRAFLFVIFTSSLIPQGLLLWWLYGERIHIAVVMAVLGIPWVVVGTMVGLWIGSHLPKARLRILAYVILVITAVVAICSPLV